MHLPAFALERYGFEAEERAGLIAEQKSAMRLVAITPGAAEEGLRVGMTAAEARALVPTVVLLEHDGVDEVEDRHALEQSFEELSDQVGFFGEDCLWIQVGSTARLFGGEEGVARRALELAADLGHRATAAIADHPVAARAVALGLPPFEHEVVPVGASRESLASLPLAYLRPDPQLLDDLRPLGIERIGPFADLDPASVAGRYPRARGLHRIARGGRGGIEDLPALPAEPLPRVQRLLAGASSVGELQFVVPDLVQRLCERLAARDLATVRVRLVLRLESRSSTSGVRAETIRVGRPSRSPATLIRLIRGRLERLTLQAPVEEIELLVDEATPDTGWQPGLSDRSEAREPLPDLLARLADQLGEEALFAAREVETWRPEGMWAPTRFPPPSRGLGARRAPAREDPVEVLEAFERGGPAPRPSVMLGRPRQIVVELAEGIPRRVEIERRPVSVRRAQGPERLCGEWWKPRDSYDRTYWTLLVEERIAWVFAEHGRWYLHGWFD